MQYVNYPAHHNNDLFNVQSPYNYFVKTNQQYSLLGELCEFCELENKRLYMGLPLDYGRTNIYLHERHAIVEKGQIIFNVASNVLPTTYKLFKDVINKYYVYNKDMEYYGKFETREEAIQCAIVKSDMSGKACIVSRILGAEIWD